MTFTIIGRDPENGAIGVATATGSIAVGAQVPHCRFGVGAVATQGWTTNVLFARRGLPLLAKGQSASHVMRTLVAEDEGRDFRQLAVMDRAGATAGWTGTANSDFKGHLEGDNVIVAGNILAGPEVLEAMSAAYRTESAPDLAGRLLAALSAGQAAGGDSRGTRSAALLVDGGRGAALNLRIDYDENPVAALAALHERSKDAVYRDFLKRLPDEQDPGRY
ncbi:DUF1028 domain-containing protein [Pelagibius marinus]|uniref:DUF1028 domain-containing protein n=1 Tax=Pelagibius marinus TaxID=2762760 RepID=UPI0018733049|nr:DUF1028 domain-containing protein [Pelagibius marinus]